MQGIAGREIFRVEGCSYFWLDAFLFAVIRGRLAPLETQLLQGLWLAEQSGQDCDAAAVDEAVTAFRYQHNLISAEETEAWLGCRAITIEDLWSYCLRLSLRNRGPQEPRDVERGKYREALLGAVRAEGFCGGYFEGFARELASALAIAAAQEQPAATGAPPPPDLADFLSFYRLPSELQGNRLAHLVHAASCLGEYLGRELEPDLLRREVQAAFVDLTRIDWALAVFESLEAAREAVLCVTKEAAALDDFAEYAQLSEESCFMRDLPEGLRAAVGDRLFSARAGEVIGPCPVDEGSALIQVREKRPPSPADPAVRERVRGEYLQRSLDLLALQSVEWCDDTAA